MGLLGDVFKGLGDAATGGLFSLGTSLISGISNNAAQKSANQANIAIANQNNQTQREIAAENNQLQVDMMRENNEFSRQMAIDMFNMENQYNSPVEQVKRLAAAGVNPAVYFGQGSGQAGTADGASPSAAGSTVSPNMPVMTTPNIQAAPSIVSGSLQALNQMVQMQLAIKQAAKAGAETSQIQALTDVQYKKLIKETENIEVQTNAQRFENEMNYLFEWSERNWRLKNLIKDVAKKGVEITTLASQGKYYEAQALLADAERELTNSRNTEIKLRIPYIVPTLQAQIDLYKAQESEEYASAAEHRAGARLSNEQASQLEDMHDFIVSIKENEKMISDKNVKIKMDTYMNEIQKIADEAQIAENQKNLLNEQIKEAQEKVKLAQKENNSYYTRIALDALGKVVQSGAIIFGLRFATAKPTPVRGFGK